MSNPEPAPAAHSKAVVVAQARGFVKKHKFITMAAAFVLVAGLMWAYRAWSGRETTHGPKGSLAEGVVPVNVVEAKPDHFQDVMQAVGRVTGGSTIDLRFEVEGSIAKFEHGQGDKVKKGDLVAQLNQGDVRLKFKRAALELSQIEKLYAIGGVSLNKLEEARVTRDLAASDLEKTNLRASRDGIVGDKDAEVGEFITPAKRIATLVDIETVMVSFGVVEKEIDHVFPGQKVVITVDTYPGNEFPGKVEKINPIVDPQTHTLGVEARLPNEGSMLLPGMFARIKITIFEQDEALFVPNDAVEKTGTGERIYIAKDGKAEARDVEIQHKSGQFSLIGKGLEPGEMVIVQKPQDLKAGAAIKIIQ